MTVRYFVFFAAWLILILPAQASDCVFILSGGIISVDADGDPVLQPARSKINPGCIQQALNKGEFTLARKTLENADIEDAQQDATLRESLAHGIDQAGAFFSEYRELKSTAGGDPAQLQQARERLYQAMTIWTDNPEYMNEEQQLDRLMARVAGGCYDIDQARQESEREILRMIEDSRTCEADADCGMQGFGCPFDCGSIVSKSAVAEIEARISRHHAAYSQGKCGSRSMYDCYVKPRQPRCVNRRCE